MDVIGFVHSPYREKFAIPRQPGLVPAKGRIELAPPFASPDAVRGLEQFSHIWVLFEFHQTKQQGWKPLVRPPRLGGNAKTGVFATRSTFRPNAIGMSVVKLEKVVADAKSVTLEISGMDLLDQTPVLDIKPYVPYSDALPDAVGGYANSAPEADMPVTFSAEAEGQLAQFEAQFPGLRELINGVLGQDPRPAYKNRNDDQQRYGVQLYNLNISWEVIDNTSHVLSITEME